MKFTITLKGRIYVSQRNDFAVFTCRRKSRPGIPAGGWAVVTFAGQVPTNLSASYRVIGEWVEHLKYGYQLKVTEWEIVQPKQSKPDWLDMQVAKSKRQPEFSDELNF